MKKKILMSLFLFTLYFSANSQPLINESFTAGTLPSGWTNSAIQGSETWLFQNSPALNSTSNGYYAVFDDFALGSGVTPNEATLTTPSFNCSGRTNVTLRLTQYWEAVEFTHGYIEISIDGGTNWIQYADYSTTTIGSLSAPITSDIDLTADAAGQSNVQVRFRYTDGNQYGKYWYIDDVQIFSNSDVAVTELLSPVAIDCGGAYSSAETVSIRIYNYSGDSISNIPVVCDVTGASTQTLSEVYAGTIAPFSYYDYTFTATLDLSNQGIHNLNIYTNLASDEYIGNDTIYRAKQQIISTLPYNQNFNANGGDWSTGGTSNWTYGTLVNFGGPSGEGHSWANRLSGSYNNSESSWLLSPPFDLTNYDGVTLSFDVKYETESCCDRIYAQYSQDGGGSWTTVRTVAGSSSNNWVHFEDNINLTVCDPTCFRIRFLFTSDGSVTRTGGGAIDNVNVVEYTNVNDAAATGETHFIYKCSYTDNESFTFSYKNNLQNVICNLPVTIEVTHPTEPTQTQTIIIPQVNPGQVLSQTFTGIDLTNTAGGDYTINMFTNLAGDTDPSNDNAPTITLPYDLNTLPYSEDFNTDDGRWASNSRWTYDQTNLWWTSNGYNNYNSTYLMSPTFDLTNYPDPIVEYDINWGFESCCDHGYFQFSLDGGSSWTTIHQFNASGGWQHITDTVHLNVCVADCVHFRYFIGSDGSVTSSGFQIDNFSMTPNNKVNDVATIDVDYLNKCTLTNAENITFSLQNVATNQVCDVPIEITVTHPSAAPQTFNATIAGPISAGQRINYVFPSTVDFSDNSGLYTVDAHINWTPDINNTNDQVIRTTKQPTINTFPYSQDFDTFDNGWVQNGSTSNFTWENTSFTKMGGNSGYGNSWVTSKEGQYNNSETGWVMSPQFDFSGLTCPTIDFWVNYDFYNSSDYVILESSIDGGATWQKVGVSGEYFWYHIEPGALLPTPYPSWTLSTDGAWVFKQHDLPSLAGESCVHFRFKMVSNNSSQDFGFAFDNVRIYDNNEDVGVTAIINPDNTFCNNSMGEEITIEVSNFSCNDVSVGNVDVRVEVTGPISQTVQEPINVIIPGNSSILHTFSTLFDFSATGTYTIKAYTIDASDPITNNDTIIKTFEVTVPRRALPYSQNFDADGDEWLSGGNSNWVWGELLNMNGAQGNGNSWATNLSGNYPNGASKWLLSPTFDFSSSPAPVINYDIKYYTESCCDHVYFQYSIDGNVTWNTVNSYAGDGYTDWIHVTDTIDLQNCNPTCVNFRFLFTSDGSVTRAGGVAIDNFSADLNTNANDASIIDIHFNNKCAYTATETVGVSILNTSPHQICEVPIVCEITHPTAPPQTLTATFSGSLAVGQRANIIFSQTADFSQYASGDYTLTAYTDVTGDPNPINDTVVRTLPIIINTYPYSSDFNTKPSEWVSFGNGTNFTWELDNFSQLNGSDGLSWVTNPRGNYNNNETSWVMSPLFDFSALSCPMIAFDLKYHSSGDNLYFQTSTDGGSTWTTQATYTGLNNYTDWLNKTISLSSLAGESCVLMRFLMTSNSSYTYAGFTFDNIIVLDNILDIGAVDIIAPIQSYCNNTDHETLTVSFKNYSCSNISNIPVTVNCQGPINTSLTETITDVIAPGATYIYTFAGTIDMSAVGIYDLEVYSDLVGDTYIYNDTAYASFDIQVPYVGTLPYIQNFNDNDGDWATLGNNSWEWGELINMNGAQGNGNSWATNLSGNYANGENDYILSPTFNFSSVTCPMVSFDLKYYTENGFDKVYFEYSIDGGSSWTTLSTRQGSEYSDWLYQYFDLSSLAGESCVMFRFYFHSDGSVTKSGGAAVDNFVVMDNAYDAGISALLNPSSSCSTSDHEQISTEITSYGCNAISNVTIHCEITGPNNYSFSEIIPGPIDPGTSIIYDMATLVDLSALGTYNVVVYLEHPDDYNTPNDTAKVTVNTIVPYVGSYPYEANFNATDFQWLSSPAGAWEWGELLNMSGSQGEGNSWATNLSGNYGNGENNYVLSPTFDFTNATCPKVSYDFKYSTESCCDRVYFQYSINGGSSWTTLSTYAGGYYSNWLYQTFDIGYLAGESCVNFRYYFHSDGSVTYSGGAFDNFSVTDSPEDPAITALISPVGLCNNSSLEPVIVEVTNVGCATVTDIPITYEITGPINATVTETIPGTLASQDNMIFQFSTLADLSVPGNYNIVIYTHLPSDYNQSNDSAFTTINVTVPRIETLPYVEDFNADNGQWYSTDWQYGAVTNFGDSEGNAWATNLSGNYGNNANISVYSPIFDLSQAGCPKLTFDLASATESGWDRVYFQYSISGGDWTTLATYEGSSAWAEREFSLIDLVGNSCVQFRFYFHSDGSVTSSGVSFDNFIITDSPIDAEPMNITGCWGSEYPIEVQILNLGNYCQDYQITDAPINFNSQSAVAKTEHTSSPALFAFDDDINTNGWGNNNSLDTWLVYDFGNGNAQIVDEYRIYCSSTQDGGWNSENYNPKTWTFEGSNNGYSWTVLDTQTDGLLTMDTWKAFTFTNSTAYQYYRIKITAAESGTWAHITELDFYNGGVLVPTEVSATASSIFELNKPENAFDGVITNSDWRNDGTMPSTLQYDFGNGNSEAVKMYEIYCSSSVLNSEDSNPKTWTFEGSNDGTSWTVIDTQNDALISQNTWKRFNTPNTTAYRFYRLNITAAENGNTTKISEVRFYTPAQVQDAETTINSIDITYIIDGSAPVTQTYTAPADFTAIAPNTSDIIQLPPIPSVTQTSTLTLWNSLPNGTIDPRFENDTIVADISQWPNCNDHCSNAIEILSSVTSVTTNNNATPDPLEDPSYSNCSGGVPVTVENSVWYFFRTDCTGGEVTVTFNNINCSPSSTGVQVSIDQLDALPECDPANYSNVFCAAPGTDDNIVWNGTNLPPDQIYYITIDGVGGNTCGFEILLEGNVAFNPVDAMSGDFVIEPSSVNFPTFQSAIDSLEMYGVNGPVHFNVADVNFNEQIQISTICGVSDVNNITFETWCDDCGKAILEHDADATDNFTLKLYRTSYLNFKNFAFNALGANNGRVLEISTNTHHINFDDCSFNGISTTDNSDALTLVYDFETITNSYNINFTNSEFNYGSSGLNFTGKDNTQNISGLNFNNCLFNNQSYSGINLVNTDAPIINQNIINSNSTRTDFRGISLITCNNDLNLTSNIVSSSSVNGYGLFVDDLAGTSGSEAQIINNMFAIGNGAGTSYGINIESSTGNSEYIDLLFNSTNVLSTNGAGIRINTADFINIKNNNFISASANSYDVSGLTNSTEDYNNFMPDYSGKGANSVSLNPAYLSSTNLHTENAALQVGDNATGISTDLDGETRQNPPYIGADEYLGNVIWTGNTDNDWNKVTNWQPNTYVSNATNVVIPTTPVGGNFPETNSSTDNLAETKNLTIQAGAHLYIAPNKYLTVWGIMNQNGTFVIKSDATGTGSFINKSSINYGAGTTTVQRYISPLMWHYVSSPITLAPVNLFNPNNFYFYDEPVADSWNMQDFSGGLMGWTFPASGSNMNIMQGYITYQNEATVEFTGELNTGELTYNLDYTDNTATHGNAIFDGWNLVGNPYPSTLNWYDNNNITKTNIDGAIYFYIDDGTGAYNNYSYFLPESYSNPYPSIVLNRVSGCIPVSQSFFVKANSPGASITVNNGARIHNDVPFYKSNIDEPHQIRLTAFNSQYSDETILRFIPEATGNYDGQLDAIKLVGYSVNVPYIFSLSNDSLNLSINSLPEIDTNSIVNLGFKTGTDGQFSITMNDFILPDSLTPYLLDLQENTETDLITNNTYEFYSNIGTYRNRFKIIFKQQTNNNDNVINPNIIVYSNKMNLFVNFIENPEPNTTITVYDITGKKIKRFYPQHKYNVYELNYIAEGIYNVMVIQNQKIYTKKIILIEN